MTTTELAPTSAGVLHVSPNQHAWTDEQTAVLAQLGLQNASPADLQVLLHQSQRTGLDPFARQIYMIERRQKDQRGNWVSKYTIQVGIDGFRLIADRTSKYRGQVGPEWCGEDGQWRDVWLASTPPAAARVGVLRSDFDRPIYAVAVFSEYAQYKNDQLTAMWASKPAIMIAKCAEALALRKAFPQDLSGMYTAEELPSVDGAVAGKSIGAAAAGAADSPVVDLPADFDQLLADADAAHDLAALKDLYAIAVQAVRAAGITGAHPAVEAVVDAANRAQQNASAGAEAVVEGEMVEPAGEQVPA